MSPDEASVSYMGAARCTGGGGRGGEGDTGAWWRAQLPIPMPCYAKVGFMHSPYLGLNPRTEPCLIAQHSAELRADIA
jgi:hypothetical protein